MQITDQDVPPEFAAAMADILTLLPSAPGSPARGRTRRKARLPLVSYTAREQLIAIKSACEILADRLKITKGSEARAAFVYAQTRAILTGVFYPQYWSPQFRTSRLILSSAPTSILDPGPPPYAYRDQNNLPTVPTYPDGALDGGLPRYTGQTISGKFCDELLVWQRSIYELDAPLEDRAGEPTFMQVTGTLQIDGNVRGSRPMTSILAGRQFGSSGALVPDDPAPPLDQNLSFYWRYRTPGDTAPFYSVAQPRDIVARLYPRKGELVAAPLESIALSVLPRPMFGRGFNNNNNISMAMSHEENIYQLTPTIGAPNRPILDYANAKPKIWDVDTATAAEIMDAQAPGVVHYHGPRFIATGAVQAPRFYSNNGNFLGTVDESGAWGSIFWQDPIWSRHHRGFQAILINNALGSIHKLVFFDVNGRLTGESGTFPFIPFYGNSKTFLGSVVPDQNVLRITGVGFVFMADAGGVTSIFNPPGGALRATLTASGLWYQHNDFSIRHLAYGAASSQIIRAMPSGGWGLSACRKGVYIATDAENCGILTLDGELEQTPWAPLPAAMNGETQNWTPT